ncbi:hypothetical protein SGO26_29440 (plasmid) [Cupriavidus metallidurans]|uniref:hypothetical protein n=1 Tax=Cupriavidus metallidurans TaxID=119219 RepID=UPI003D719ED0
MDTQNKTVESAQKAHQERLISLAEDARKLLAFAAANARAVESEIRDPLLKSAKAVTAGTSNVEDEQSFLKAYEALTIRTAPVTAATIEASKTRLPEIEDLFSWGGLRAWKKLTLGRFLNAIIFIVVLIITGVTLSYNAVGVAGLQRYAALTEPESKAATAEKMVLDGIREEQEMLVKRLWKWSQQPCRNDAYLVFRWTLCSTIDDGGSMIANEMNDYRSPGERLEAAKAVAARLSGVYLPLLLGWLGAQAYILRKMTREIAENAFAQSSALHHIARVGLGALAGFASVWLLTPETVGGDALKKLPPWALAFIAGYGIELVFSFMDRLISAFSTKSA